MRVPWKMLALATNAVLDRITAGCRSLRWPALAVASLTLAASCPHPTGNAQRLADDPSILTREQMRGPGLKSIHEALEALRPNWLEQRGGGRPTSEIHVFLDDTYAGGLDALDLFLVSTVLYVRRYSGSEAEIRWGAGHSGGVIFVATHPAGVGQR